MQDKVNTGGIPQKLIRYADGFGLAYSLIHGNLEGVAAAGGITGAYLTAQQVGKLLMNPKTARIMVNLAGGEPLGVADSYAGRAIANVLHGATIGLVNADGSRTPTELK